MAGSAVAAVSQQLTSLITLRHSPRSNNGGCESILGVVRDPIEGRSVRGPEEFRLQTRSGAAVPYGHRESCNVTDVDRGPRRKRRGRKRRVSVTAGLVTPDLVPLHQPHALVRPSTPCPPPPPVSRLFASFALSVSLDGHFSLDWGQASAAAIAPRWWRRTGGRRR